MLFLDISTKNKRYKESKHMFKKIIKNILPTFAYNFILPYWKQWINFKTLAFKYNQFETIKKNACIDKNKKPIPWYTYPAIEYLSNLDFSEKIVFEWGGGNSSLFWANRCKKLVTVENNSAWFKMLQKSKLENQEIFCLESKDMYVSLPLTLSTHFDIFIVDGQWRKECIEILLKLKRERSDNSLFVIFDNSDRYQDLARKLRDSGFIEIDFHGFAPINSYTHTTSIFFTTNIQITPIENFQPNYSIASIREDYN